MNRIVRVVDAVIVRLCSKCLDRNDACNRRICKRMGPAVRWLMRAIQAPHAPLLKMENTGKHGVEVE